MHTNTTTTWKALNLLCSSMLSTSSSCSCGYSNSIRPHKITRTHTPNRATDLQSQTAWAALRSQVLPIQEYLGVRRHSWAKQCKHNTQHIRNVCWHVYTYNNIIVRSFYCSRMRIWYCHLLYNPNATRSTTSFLYIHFISVYFNSFIKKQGALTTPFGLVQPVWLSQLAFYIR